MWLKSFSGGTIYYGKLINFAIKNYEDSKAKIFKSSLSFSLYWDSLDLHSNVLQEKD